MGKLLHHRKDAQALVLVALTLSLLVTLIVGVNAIALRRRTQARIQDSLDQAAIAAVSELSTAALVGDAPALLPAAVEKRFRAQLEIGLRRVASTVRPDPTTVARQAHVSLVAAGQRCHDQPVSAPGVCADLTLTIASVLGSSEVRLTTLAQVARSG